MHSRYVLIAGAHVLVTCSQALSLPHSHQTTRTPVVQTSNGTLHGINLPSFSQVAFLGVPYADPPIDDLRLRHPVPLSKNYQNYPATAQPASCPGYAGFDIDIGELSEDCLYLNIIGPDHRLPSGELLPVLVWIYGGGFDAGGIADPRYNVSYLVQEATDMGKPTIVVSINYRVGGWGFLASKEILEDGVANIGLFDQRLALYWLKENIAAFGGDPDRITIWGESAGAFSVGYHLVGFDGDNSDLFRAAILESGTMLGQPLQNNLTIAQEDGYQAMYDNVTVTVGCSDATDTLACLRTVPYKTLFEAFKPQVYTPIVDGTFITRFPSESLVLGKVADVAILIGANTDEGTASFWGPRGTSNTTEDVSEYIKGLNGGGLSYTEVVELLDLYPDDPSQGCPYDTGNNRFEDQGWMYKRSAAISGDLNIHAGRRATAEYFSGRRGRGLKRTPVYSYRFDQPPWNAVEELIATVAPVYSTHYTELIFVFHNPSQNLTNYIGPYPSYHRLSTFMCRAWLSFAHGLDPNGHGISSVPHWPAYTTDHPTNIVFRADDNQNGTYVELDDYRDSQLAWWNEHWSQLRS